MKFSSIYTNDERLMDYTNPLGKNIFEAHYAPQGFRDAVT